MGSPVARDRKISHDLQRLISAGIQDMATYLLDRDIAALRSICHDPRSVLSYVSEELSDTDSKLSFRRYVCLRQLEALLKKNLHLPGTHAQGRKEAAMNTFYKSERKCKRTNRRLKYYFSHPSRIPSGIREVLNLARLYLDDIFGPMTHATFTTVVEHSRFGPGHTFGSSGPDGNHLYFKVGGTQTVTDEALPYAKVFLNRSKHWKQALISEGGTFDRVRGNRVATVYKTADTDRTIAIEPSLNVMLQKGVETYLTGRLRYFGVSLSNQERNSSVARIASVEPLYAATMDLEAASDSISIELVRWMIPHLWYVLLDDLRSKEYTVDKGESWHTYEKFSSMGNAFTFPLESALFYALAKACTVYSGGDLERLRVYGDDIIIDTRAALLLSEVLEFTGFSVNTKKSYFFGPFRETCGTDFLSGVDTRPVYFSCVPQTDQEAYNLFNRLIWNRVGLVFHNLCEVIHSFVKKPFYGPPDLPAVENYSSWYAGKSVIYDHYFHAPPDVGERFKRYDENLQRHVWWIQLLRFRPKRLNTSSWNLQFHYLTFLYGLSGKEYVESLSRFRRTLPYELFVRWSEPPWRPMVFGF